MAGWFKRAEDTTMAGPSGMPPMAPVVKAPEKEDVREADDILKDLEKLIKREVAEGEQGEKRDVGNLEEAVKKLEAYIKDEAKEEEKRAKEREKEAEKAKKEQEKAEKEMKKNEPKGE